MSSFLPICINVSVLCACYMPLPSYPPSLDHLNNILCTVQIVFLLSTCMDKWSFNDTVSTDKIINFINVGENVGNWGMTSIKFRACYIEGASALNLLVCYRGHKHSVALLILWCDKHKILHQSVTDPEFRPD